MPKRLPTPVVDVEALGDEDERGVLQQLHRRLVGDVQRRLVDQADLHALLLEADDGVERAVERVAERDDVPAAGGRFADDVVLARLELVALAEERLAVFVEDVRHRRCGCEKTKRRPGSLKIRFTHARELVLVGGEVQPRDVVVVVRQAVGGEHVVDAEVAGVVGHVVARRRG